ncbi:hypothetical protein [Paenibacillus cymbidii]|uniref:hypothetical protein n=1 Tax=Paenibacillus cymbidii TaxID=1639034 RepID=UPI001080BF90|nr:hypothetical protein [Paenibacillus cymbidii]
MMAENEFRPDGRHGRRGGPGREGRGGPEHDGPSGPEHDGHGGPGREGRGERGGHGGHGGGRHGRHGEREDGRNAQTFRRGRALAFLDRLQLRRSTLERQLARPELSGIRDVIGGELKATDQIIEEFIHAFELYEANRPPESGEQQEKLPGAAADGVPDDDAAANGESPDDEA